MSNQLTTQQQGWLHLAEIKRNLFDELQAAELAVQGKLNGIKAADLETAQSAIKESKTILADAKGKRLAFSRMIDEKLLTPSMQYEKRMLENIETAGKYELELRKQAEKSALEAQAYQSEVAAYKAHITNEWFRIAHQYRTELKNTIDYTYTSLLKDKVGAEKVPEIIEDLTKVLLSIKLPTPNKFQRNLLDDAAAKQIVSEIKKYNPKPDLDEAIAEVNKRFTLYENDLQNADAAAKAIEEQAKLDAEENAKRLAAEQATNVLIAQAETVIVDTPKVKREIKIVIIESEQWAMTVTANFLKNWQYVNKYVRVKSWAKLTISQMADALAKHISETGEEISGLQIEEICK